METLAAGKFEIVDTTDPGDGCPIFKVRHGLLGARLTGGVPGLS